MSEFNKENLSYAKNVSLKTVLEDAIQHLNEYGGDNVGIEYTVAEIFGGKLKLVFDPDVDCHDILEVDGVNGFGYCAVIEVDGVKGQSDPEKSQLIKALAKKSGELDIISMVTGISESRLKKIIAGEEMTEV